MQPHPDHEIGSRMNTIILGLDGSKGSQVAARWTTVAAGPETRVVAVYVMPRSELWTLGALQVDAKPIVDEFKALLDGPWTQVLRKAGFRIQRVSCEAIRQLNCCVSRRG